MDIGIVALIVLLFLGTGIIWLSRKEGSFAWHWRTKLFGDLGAEAQGKKERDQVQKQTGGIENEQIASKQSTSYQEQSGGKKNKQTIK